jgi:hypothetical protein
VTGHNTASQLAVCSKGILSLQLAACRRVRACISFCRLQWWLRLSRRFATACTHDACDARTRTPSRGPLARAGAGAAAARAASFLGGLMRMSASMCLILMEMTGAPGTLPFLMMVLVIAKGVGDRFNYRRATGLGVGLGAMGRGRAVPAPRTAVWCRLLAVGRGSVQIKVPITVNSCAPRAPLVIPPGRGTLRAS